MGNILNLVFDSWKEDGSPLPNLSHLNVDGEKVILPFYIFVLKPSDIKLNLCKPSDVSEGESYYYFVHFNESLYDGKSWEISEEIENLVLSKKLRIVFYNEHESYTNPKKYYTKLLETLKFKNIDESLIYLVNNCSELYEIKSSNPSGINVFKTDYLIELISKYISVRTDTKDLKEEKKFLFLCHNRRPKPHRVSLLTLLNSEGLLDESDTIDWSLTYGVPTNFNLDSENFGGSEIFNTEYFLKSFNKLKDLKKLSFYEDQVNWFDNEKNYDANYHISVQSHLESYINIVTESHFSINSVHITEKSFKPFYYFQMPLFVASHRHVEFLKKEHNLYLFEDLIDHSYDREIDHIKRLHLIVEEIKRLSKLGSEIKKYYLSNREKFIHNHNYIKEFQKNRSMDSFFISLCK